MIYNRVPEPVSVISSSIDVLGMIYNKVPEHVSVISSSIDVFRHDLQQSSRTCQCHIKFYRCFRHDLQQSSRTCQLHIKFYRCYRHDLQQNSRICKVSYQVLPGRVAQLVTCLATDECLAADPGVGSLIPVQSHTFVEIDHEMISTVILLPSADSSRRVVVSYKRKYVHESLVNGLYKPAHEKVWLGELTVPQ